MFVAQVWAFAVGFPVDLCTTPDECSGQFVVQRELTNQLLPDIESSDPN
jgi:hypothetical protein